MQPLSSMLSLTPKPRFLPLPPARGASPNGQEQPVVAFSQLAPDQSLRLWDTLDRCGLDFPLNRDCARHQRGINP